MLITVVIRDKNCCHKIELNNAVLKKKLLLVRIV